MSGYSRVRQGGALPMQGGPCGGLDTGTATTRRGLIRGLAALPLLGAPLLAAPLLAACGIAERGQQGSQADGWLPAPAAMPGRLLVVDSGSVGLDTQVALAILQGIINRRVRPGGEGLYLLIPDNYVGGVAFRGADARWLDIYRTRYGIRTREGTPADAVALARSLGCRHYVVWDPALPATINVANTLAWLHGAAAVSPGDASSVLRGPASVVTGGLDLAGHGFRELLDLRAQHFADAAAAYRWALQQLRGQSPGALALLSVGDLRGDATEGVVRWTPRDYAVVTRAFAWIGSMDDTGPESHGGVLQAMLATVAGRRVSMFGWSNNESRQTIFCSSHGINFIGADTPGLSAENLSVHSAVRRTARQQSRPPAPALDQGAVYASIVVTDGDNISVLIDFHEGRWLDPARGQVPVGWSMQGMAPGWTPGIAGHYFDSATENDEMVAWLPFGYPDVPSFVGHPMWPQYVASAQAAMRAAGLRVGQCLPHTGEVLSPSASGLSDLLRGRDAPDGFVLGYTSIDGYPAGQPLWIHGRPVFPMGGFGAGRDGSQAQQAIAAISNTAQAVSRRPLFLVVGLQNGTRYADAMQVARAAYPVPVHFVLPGQLVDLAREAWDRGLLRTQPLANPAEYGLRDAFFLRAARDAGAQSSPAAYLRDGRTFQMRQASDGGQWTYAFDVEGCRTASVEIHASGTGAVEVGRDGKQWQAAGSLDVPWGQQAVLTVDLSGLLPAEQVLLRFRAPSGGTLAVTDMSVWYNRVLPGAAPPGQAVPVTDGAGAVQLPAAHAEAVSLELAAGGPSLELAQVGAHQGDSLSHIATVGGQSAAVFDPNAVSPGDSTTYLYFVANVPGWTFAEPRTLYLTAEYYDAPAGGHLAAMYNSTGTGLPGAYASAGTPVTLGGTEHWKTVTWELTRARFARRQNFGADFRLAGTAGVAVHRITLSLRPPAP